MSTVDKGYRLVYRFTYTDEIGHGISVYPTQALAQAVPDQLLEQDLDAEEQGYDAQYADISVQAVA